MKYAGLYLLIGVIMAHIFMKLVNNKVQKDIDTDEISKDTQTIINESDKLQKVYGYNKFISITYGMLAVIWLPALCYVLVSRMIGGKKK